MTDWDTQVNENKKDHLIFLPVREEDGWSYLSIVYICTIVQLTVINPGALHHPTMMKAL